MQEMIDEMNANFLRSDAFLESGLSGLARKANDKAQDIKAKLLDMGCNLEHDANGLFYDGDRDAS